MNDVLNNIRSSDLFQSILPGIMAIIILILGYLIAKLISSLISKGLKKTTFLSTWFETLWASVDMKSIAKIVSNIVFYTIMLFVLMAFFEKLWLNSIIAPINTFINQGLPGILSALWLIAIAWLIATILRFLTIKWWRSLEIDEKLNKQLDGEKSIVLALWNILYWFVLLFFTPAILWALGQEELLLPITDIINQITGYIPNLIAAIVILGISFFLAKIISKIITELLSWIWFDNALESIGLKNLKDKTKASSIIGMIVFIYIMLLATIEAANKLEFSSLTPIIENFIIFGTNILVGVIIFTIGLFIANFAYDTLKSTSNSKALPIIVKASIIIFTGAMWLKQMWIADDIINLAFWLTLWSLALWIALAIWFWAKDTIWEEVKNIVEKMKK